ncbi:MFS transporter [Chryseolinea lacunae]|uniref:MFS transporter n=1 Tax=Chryseolinea lacunae TaxID=2801331 RepID=A0ABS1L4C6_9BACT|nr:MFS transporter [Chryseolinea lacunae]MBL0745792.1 MFS transporter [Chryseolinea lacunae]
MINQHLSAKQALFSAPVIVASLGYFVDIYDLLLFGIVRLPSLQAIGVSSDALSMVGASVLNWQMLGMLMGGVLWGVLGDKQGRLSVLFGSIITYSLANVACGAVGTVEMYKVFRFIAGVGLAGELGVGITLVAESVPTRYRALGTSLVSAVGLLGAVVAFFTVKLFDWRTAYFVGGGMGLSLLVLRINVAESSVFSNARKQKHIQRGNFLSLFVNWDKFRRYMCCVGIGLPTWFVIGILATFANEVGEAKNVFPVIDPGLAIMWCYVGLSVGDMFSGFLSYWLKSRKQAIGYLLGFTIIISMVGLLWNYATSSVYYIVISLAGFGIGYWAMFVTVAAEQFGANLRATVATTVPNMVRGSLVLLVLAYQFLKLYIPVHLAALTVGIICFVLAFSALLAVSETYDRDMDFVE